VLVEIAVGIAVGIHERTFLNVEPEVAGYDDIRRAGDERRDLVLYRYFNHAVVHVAGSVSDFQLDHDRAGANVAACERNAGTRYRTAVAAVHRRNTTRDVVDARAFRRPVKVDAAVHPTCAERYRAAVVVGTVVKYPCRYQRDAEGTVIRQGDYRVVVAV